MYSANYLTQWSGQFWTTGNLYWCTTVHLCVKRVNHRAVRFYLGLGKYAPNLAINSYVRWTPPEI